MSAPRCCAASTTSTSPTASQLAQLFERLAGDHDVLEIDGRRVFAYDTVYVDTEDLRCFRDHIEDVRPRFKARTRCYVDAGDCVFEVKVKREDGETDKRQTDDLDARRELVEETLRDDGIEPPGELHEVLRTSFDRVTLAAREGGARLTIDLGVTLATMDGESVRMRDGLALVETKSEDGESPGDRALAELGARQSRSPSTARASTRSSGATRAATSRRRAGCSCSHRTLTPHTRRTIGQRAALIIDSRGVACLAASASLPRSAASASSQGSPSPSRSPPAVRTERTAPRPRT